MKKWMIIMAAAMMITACGQKDKETAPAQTEVTAEGGENSQESSGQKAPVESEAEETEEEKSQTGKEEKEENKITGTVIDAAMNSIIIKTEDGRELAFSKEDAKSDLKNGLTLGIKVTLTYTGEIRDDDTSGAKVTEITDAQ